MPLFRLNFDDDQKPGTVAAHVGIGVSGQHEEGNDLLQNAMQAKLAELQQDGKIVAVKKSHLPGCQLVEFNSLDGMRSFLDVGKKMDAKFEHHSGREGGGYFQALQDAELMFKRSIGTQKE